MEKILFVVFISVLSFKLSDAFCAHGYGGIGEYHKECPTSAGDGGIYKNCCQ